MTAELTLVPLYDLSDGEKPRISSSVRKLFSEDPTISADGAEIRVLSVSTGTSSEEIRCKIIIRTSESSLSGDRTVISAEWGGFTAEAVVKIKKDPADFIDDSGVVTDAAAFDALVNKKRRLPADYIPEDLVRIDVPTILTFEEVNHLRKPASDALFEMFRAAEEEEGFILTARSGYRSYRTQVSLFDSNVRAHGREYADKFSAKPGTSEHQSGLAMDITAEVMNYQLEQSFGETAEGIWTAANAHRFGFIIRYPEGKEKITGYAYEPWHLRYVGKALAEEIYGKKITLEEYYGVN